jgi:UV DNA damage endonuclease
MTVVRLGYVAMSMQLKNSSPSQTMTFTQFEKLSNRDAAIKKLERIAKSNLQNCLRLLKHNVAHDIRFFRLSSKLIPLANHPELEGWNFMRPLKDDLAELGAYIKENDIRVDFHPDHFVLLNSPDDDILKNSVKTLQMHMKLLQGMGIDQTHRCVMHVGGSYKDKDSALERFITNFGRVSERIQRMIMLENDDTTFNLDDTLYLCEKLGLPLVFDYHHHLAHHENENWHDNWDRIVNTWAHSPLPIKMHISSPKSEDKFRHHADVIDSQMFLKFLNEIKGSVEQIDCMIEAKKKDVALFTLMRALAHYPEIEIIDGASFRIRD